MLVQIKDISHAAVAVLMVADTLNQLQMKPCTSNRPGCHISAFHQLPERHHHLLSNPLGVLLRDVFRKTTYIMVGITHDDTTGLSLPTKAFHQL